MVDYLFKGIGIGFLAIIGGVVAIAVLPALVVALVESVRATFVAVGDASPIGAIMLFIAILVVILTFPLPQR